MNTKFMIFVTMIFVLAVGLVNIQAKDLARQKPIEVLLELDEFSFKPSKLEFKVGKLYKLLIKNIGKIKHEVDAAAITNFAYTRKIEVIDKKGKMLAEIKGNPAEVEVGPDSQLEWWFVPMTKVEPEEFVCLLPGHYESGMKGMISFK